MYFMNNKQISLFKLGQSAGIDLDPENRWVKMVHKIDWDKIEDKYRGLYCLDNGAPAKPIRLAICALLIGKMESMLDERLVLHIQENPYIV